MEAFIKPSVCFEIEKIIGVSISEENVRSYQVQWAPTWVTCLNLVGCERLIEEFDKQQLMQSNLSIESACSSLSWTHRPGCEPETKLPKPVGHVTMGVGQKELLLPEQTLTDEDGHLEINIQETHTKCPTIHISNINVEEDAVDGASELIDSIQVKNNLTPSPANPSFIDLYSRRYKGSEKLLTSKWPNSSNKTLKLCACNDDKTGLPYCEGHSHLLKPLERHKASVASISTQIQKEQKPATLTKDEHALIDRTASIKSEDVLSVNNTCMNDSILMDESCNKHHSCAVCGKGFTKRHGLRVHERIHSGDKPYKCDECDQAFSQRGNLTKHMRLHTGEKPFVCSECGRSFTASNNMRRHIKKLHPNAAWWVE